MTNEEKDWIDNATYDELLSKWRFAKVGDPLFQSETGVYYGEVMAEKKKQCYDPVKVSKRVGWGV